MEDLLFWLLRSSSSTFSSPLRTQQLTTLLLLWHLPSLPESWHTGGTR